MAVSTSALRPKSSNEFKGSVLVSNALYRAIAGCKGRTFRATLDVLGCLAWFKEVLLLGI